MGPFHFADPRALEILELWFSQTDEIFAELYVSHSGSSGDLSMLASMDQYHQWITLRDDWGRPHKVTGYLLRAPQLPLRGVVDDEFIARALDYFDPQTHVVGYAPPQSPHFMDFHVYGQGPEELKPELESMRSQTIWLGAEPYFYGIKFDPYTNPGALVVQRV